MRPSSSLCIAALVLGPAAFASCRYATSLDGYAVESGFGGGGGGSGTGGSGGVLQEAGPDTPQSEAGGSSGDSGDAAKVDGDASIPPDAPDVVLPDTTESGNNCSSTRVDCDGNESNGCEVDTSTDKDNCGGCGHSCEGGDCKSSTCQPVILATGQTIPWGIAVDSTTVFWSNQGASANQGEIRSIPIEGGTSKALTQSQSTPGDITLDSANVFWSNYTGGGSVMKIGKDGTGVGSISSGSGPWSLAVDTDTVYWTNSNGDIRKVLKSGGSSTTIVTAEQDPRGIAIDGAMMYWTSAGSGKVMSAAKADGGSKKDEATGQSFPIAIYVTASAIYWVNAGSYAMGSCTKNDGSVMKLVKGQGTPIQLASTQACPVRLTVDAESVYWTNAGTYNGSVYDYNGAVMKVSTSGGSSVAVASGQGVISPYGIAVDDKNVYWTTQGLGAASGTVVRMVKK